MIHSVQQMRILGPNFRHPFLKYHNLCILEARGTFTSIPHCGCRCDCGNCRNDAEAATHSVTTHFVHRNVSCVNL